MNTDIYYTNKNQLFQDFYYYITIINIKLYIILHYKYQIS